MSDVLLLNFTYEPLKAIDVQRAVKLLFKRKAEIVDAAPASWKSMAMAFPIPKVIRMLYYINRSRQTVPLTKKNVMLRDDHRCGYCGVRGVKMNVDHIVPSSRGGPSTWTNLITSCTTCNSRKRNRTPEEAGMPLLKKPRQPHYIPWVVIKRNTVPEEWAKYLTLYNVSIEERVG